MTWQLASDLRPIVVLLLAGGLAGLVWVFYSREPGNSATGNISFSDRPTSHLNWLLPSLRAAAVFLVTLTLGQPILESRIRIGEPGSVRFLIDGSRSMSLQDAVMDGGTGADSSRFTRAADTLSGNSRHSGLVAALTDEFDVTVSRFGDDSPLAELWSAYPNPSTTPATSVNWTPGQWADSSAIGDALLKAATSFGSDNRERAEQVVVLLSDGCSNIGVSPLEAAEKLKMQGIKVFSVGFGQKVISEDLAALSAKVPPRVFQSEMLTGSVSVSENIVAGTSYSIAVEYDGQLVWEQAVISKGLTLREVDFSVAAKTLFELARKSLPPDASLFALPVKLDIKLATEVESNTNNNQVSTFTTVAMGQSKILLLDGRSRWETRYIHNMFSRDPAWNITCDIRHPNDASDASPQSRRSIFPNSREELLDFNLVILGDVPAESLQREQWEWLREYVDRHGGGLIMIDGARQQLRSDGFSILNDLLPVRWTGPPSDQLLFQAFPTTAGQESDALQLNSDAATGSLLDWPELPLLQFRARVQALPGSEVLLEAIDEIGASPLMVFRKFGAGKVLYSATDETWKWRYNVAERIQSQLWHQLARWVMRAPYSVESEFLSLDAGPPSYSLGQPVDIRCQLRNADASPAQGVAVSAVISCNQQVVSNVTLVESTTLPGSYAATADSLPPGDYSVKVEAAGFPQAALALVTRFTVVASENREMQAYACNQELLEEIAEQTGGRYFHESEIGALADSIRPLSGGKFERWTLLLWQSYWWFFLAIALLVAEWILRKRAGLV